MALVQLVGQIRTPIVNLSGLFPQVAAFSASCERLQSLESQALAAAAPAENAMFAALRYTNVNYAYPNGQQALHDFNLQVCAGETVALTGPSGIGKSTALLLALDMDVPQKGQVNVDFHSPNNNDGDNANVVTQTFNAANLAPGKFAYVPQGNMLMSGAIAEAVAFAEESQIDESRLAHALHAACADEFVGKLSLGTRSQLGEHGTGLSEGQMQRLAVARAVYSNADVLLLDECTSALDEACEAEMLKRLTTLGRTIIIVSHKPAALAVCDRVIQLS